MKMNKLLSGGLLITALALISKQLFTLPESIYGFLMGLGISLEIVGIIKARFKVNPCAVKRNIFKPKIKTNNNN
ncbi:hypothetical protein IMX26_00900 [Clostridium sp. 'deep sea']|uniref:hypothetical protein n=1 Tax=Clostridium sp. 'deep sea' TaxID=2779445 RepID=UPI0018967F01|nr:hypothetical protein [Clostridium sp. 'deep sea']QOR35434.1 hypothetical protein IMX26_00900 [Clostridium sp. 'deep sea']